MDEKYDKEEMKRRDLIFEITKLDVLCSSVLEVIEWEKLKETYKFQDSDYPTLARAVASAKSLLENDSAAYRTLFENPLTKLAIISQRFNTKNDTEEKKDNE